jgi:hypothetical protein
VKKVYMRGRKASQRVHASAEAYKERLKKNLADLPIFARYQAEQVIQAINDLLICTQIGGDDLLTRKRPKELHERYSAKSVALIWWRYYFASSRNQYWKDLFELACVWEVSTCQDLASFKRTVTALTQGQTHIPTPPRLTSGKPKLSQKM